MLTKSGDVKKGAANEVVLLKTPTALADRYHALCKESNERFRQAVVSDSVIYSRLTDRNDRISALTLASAHIVNNAKQFFVEARALIHSAAYRTSPTGMNAHYTFDAVPPGTYVISAMMSLGDEIHDWFVPVELAVGSRLVKDLDNTTVFSGRWDCDIGLPFP